MGVACQYIDLRYPHDWRGQHPRLKQWFGGIRRAAVVHVDAAAGIYAGAVKRR